MIAISDNRCCAGCKHWKMGPYWFSDPYKNRGIECKGTCHAKKNVRQRWNYISARNCKLYEPRPNRSVIITGDEPLNFDNIQ